MARTLSHPILAPVPTCPTRAPEDLLERLQRIRALAARPCARSAPMEEDECRHLLQTIYDEAEDMIRAHLGLSRWVVDIAELAPDPDTGGDG